MDAIITHQFVNPRASHVETHLSSRVAAACPHLLLHIKNHVYKESIADFQHNNAIRLASVRKWVYEDEGTQNVPQK